MGLERVKGAQSTSESNDAGTEAMLSGPLISSMTLKVMSWKRTFQRENLQKMIFLSIVSFM